MGVMEDIYLKAKVAAGKIGEKTSLWVDVSKLQIKLVETKSDLKTEFKNLGKVVYHACKNGESKEEAVETATKKIDTLLERVESLKIEIAMLKNKSICKNCGKANDIDDCFCSKCGENIEDACFDCSCECECEKVKKDGNEDDFKDFDE